MKNLLAIIKELNRVYYAIVSEAGASVYSASKEAQREFPNLEVQGKKCGKHWS